MDKMPRSIVKPKLLIGEGVEEVRFFDKLLAHLNINDVQVEEYKGKLGLSSYLYALRNQSGYEGIVSLGVTRDADSDAEDAFRSVCEALKRARLPAPTTAGASAAGRPQVSVLIFPDGRKPGMLEDVCLAAVETDSAMECVNAFFDCIKEKTKRLPCNMAKARVHAWLSSQPEPDRRLAEAAEADYWPWDKPAFDQLKEFLSAL